MSTQLSVDDLRDRRDSALAGCKRVEASLADIDAQIKAREQEKMRLTAMHQQLMANLIASQALVSGLNIALGEEPLPNSIPNGILS